MDKWTLHLTTDELVEIRIALAARIDLLNEDRSRPQVFEGLRRTSLERCIGVYKDINLGLANG